MSVHLDPASVEAIAQRVAELLRTDTTQPGEGMLSAAEVARRFGVSRDYVYAHAADLGAVKLGDGPKARLRFDAASVAAALRSESPEPAPAPTRSPRRRRARREGDLLPVRGEPA